MKPKITPSKDASFFRRYVSTTASGSTQKSAAARLATRKSVAKIQLRRRKKTKREMNNLRAENM